MQPLDYCREKAQTSHSNFLASFRFLPPAQRDAMTILYAYCRELDDIEDDSRDPSIARATPEHPVNQALRSISPTFRLPENELADIINGMEMDLHHSRYANFDDLQYYCYRVAGVVGRLIARILGYTQDTTLQYAQTLGLALQLTNIIRDVGEDARMGRIYLPQDELAQFGVSETSILAATPTPEFAALMQFQFNRARDTYRQAIALLPPADKKAQKAGLIMASIYHALLLEIERDGLANVLRYKIRIPNPRKMRIALKTWLFGFKP